MDDHIQTLSCSECQQITGVNLHRIDSTCPHLRFCNACWSMYDRQFEVSFNDVDAIDVSDHEHICASRLYTRLNKKKSNDTNCYSQKAVRKIEERKR